MPPLPTIACKECGHVNEGERVYCHNCGTKLDRTVLVNQQQQEAETPEQKQRRVKKMMNPDAGLGRGWWKGGVKAIVWAAVVAALVDIAMPPREVPPMPKEKYVDAPPLGMSLENLSMAAPGQRVRFTEKEINDYLQNTVKMKKEGSPIFTVVAFQRVFTQLEKDAITITFQNALRDYPIYAGITYRLEAKNNKMEATPLGAHFGRLQIPAPAAKYAGVVFQPIWDALRREAKLMDKVGSVEILKDEMILGSRPADAPSAPAKP